MAATPTAYELEQGDIVLPPTGRPVVHSTLGVISSGHYLTSMAGMRMLLNGGNAFDAAVAAGFAALAPPGLQRPNDGSPIQRESTGAGYNLAVIAGNISFRKALSSRWANW